jgi:hypothetical protein
MFLNVVTKCAGKTYLVYLTKGRVCVVDTEDILLILEHNWRATRSGKQWYAITGQHGLSMHRLIMGDPADLLVHHLDGDGLNNRRANLILVTKGEHNTIHAKSKYEVN